MIQDLTRKGNNKLNYVNGICISNVNLVAKVQNQC